MLALEDSLMRNNHAMPDYASSFTKELLADVNLLVVEDNEDNQNLIYHFLSPVGAAIATANNGAQGLTMALAQSFDLILMDIQMPIMDGIETTKRIRTAGITTPIVAYTAFTSDECRRSCLKAGCNAFLGKPSSRIAMVNLIRSCLALDDRSIHREVCPTAIPQPDHETCLVSHRSIYHDDPVVGPLLEGFIHRLPERISALIRALGRDNITEAAFLAHQLKGTMLGYGFISDGKVIAEIERKVRDNHYHDLQTSILPSLAELERIFRSN